MRCAVIEFNRYHEETLPTFVRLLNELDIEPDVYLVRRSRRRRPFALADGLRYRMRRSERIDAYLGLPFRLRRYQLLIVNSMEPPHNTERLRGTRTPVLGVMHNPELLSTETAYSSFFARPNRTPLVLGRHIAANLTHDGRPLGWVSHVYFGEPGVRRRPLAPTAFAVPGNVEFGRRNYSALLDAVEELTAEGMALRIRIIGRSRRPDGQQFIAEIQRRGLAAAFYLSPGEVKHPQFLRLLASSDFVAPLIDRTDERMRPYFESKVTASVHQAIGLGVPLVAHRDLAEAYGVAHAGVCYADGGLAEAMRAAVKSDARQRAAWREALRLTRDDLLEASRSNLRDAISMVTQARRR